MKLNTFDKTLKRLLNEADEQVPAGPQKQQVTVQIEGVVKAIKMSLGAYSQAMNELNERVMKKMLAFSSSNSELASSNQALHKEVSSLNDKFTSHKQELDQIKAALSKLLQHGRDEDRATIEELGSKVEGLQSSVEENLQKIEKISSELQSTSQAGSHYAQELESYISDLTAESDDTRAKLEALKGEYAELHKKFQHSLKFAPTIHADANKNYGKFDLYEHLRREKDKELSRKGGGWKMGDW